VSLWYRRRGGGTEKDRVPAAGLGMSATTHVGPCGKTAIVSLSRGTHFR
jgi:hypothetical protein